MKLKELQIHVENLKKDEKNSHGYRAYAAYEMLESSDEMIEAFFVHKNDDHGHMLLSVFGLLQALFVAIDALYDLSIGLTRFKYHININANPKLHELKYIRNDIVGHPTHRTYFDGGVGFSILNASTLTHGQLTYDTYIFQKNHYERKETVVEFKPLIEAYYKERDILLKGLIAFIHKQEDTSEIPELTYRLFESLNLDVLEDVTTLFKKTYDIKPDDHHRFIWRGRLLRKAILWDTQDNDFNELILYVAKQQAKKMYEIALNLENRYNKDLYAKPPGILVDFYRFIRSNEAECIDLLENLHDRKHPLFDSDLEAMMRADTSKSVLKLLKWFQNIDDEDKTYLIGSQFKTYRRHN